MNLDGGKQNLASSKALTRKLSFRKLVDKECLRRFLFLLGCAFEIEVVENKGATVVSHRSIVIDSGCKFDIVLYSTGTLLISSSPKTGDNTFAEVVRQVEKIANQSTERIAEKRPLTSQRAESIMGLAESFELPDEDMQVVAVVLCDTAAEIILTEQMRCEKISGKALSESLSKKIEYLEEKNIIVPLKKEILSLRHLRNDVVHKGVIPDKNQTESARDVLRRFIELM